MPATVALSKLNFSRLLSIRWDEQLFRGDLLNWIHLRLFVILSRGATLLWWQKRCRTPSENCKDSLTRMVQFLFLVGFVVKGRQPSHFISRDAIVVRCPKSIWKSSSRQYHRHPSGKSFQSRPVALARLGAAPLGPGTAQWSFSKEISHSWNFLFSVDKVENRLSHSTKLKSAVPGAKIHHWLNRFQPREWIWILLHGPEPSWPPPWPKWSIPWKLWPVLNLMKCETVTSWKGWAI